MKQLLTRYVITVLIIITVPGTLFLFMPAVASTSGHHNCELVLFLFLKTHRETDTAFTFLQLQELRACTTQQEPVPFPSLCFLLPAQIQGRQHPIHSPLPLTTLSPPIHFPLLRYPLPPLHLVCTRLLHPPALVLSLSPHPHPFSISPTSACFIRYNKICKRFQWCTRKPQWKA